MSEESNTEIDTDTEYMLTTSDNPYNPFTNYKEWYAFDVASGYNTCSYLARVAKSSDELSENEESTAIDQAMDEIIEFNLSGVHIKVSRDYFNRDSQVKNVE